MGAEKKVRDAGEILKRAYVKGSQERQASLEEERVNAQVAQMIYELRTDAGLTQNELARMIGTTQSVISRLEDADYEGHSLSILRRIAKALDQELTVVMTPRTREFRVVRDAFVHALRDLRSSAHPSTQEAAQPSRR